MPDFDGLQLSAAHGLLPPRVDDSNSGVRLCLLPACGGAQQIIGLRTACIEPACGAQLVLLRPKYEEDRPRRRSSRFPNDNAIRFDELRFRFILVVIVVEQGPIVFGFLVVLVNRARLLFKDNAHDEANHQAQPDQAANAIECFEQEMVYRTKIHGLQYRFRSCGASRHTRVALGIIPHRTVKEQTCCQIVLSLL